MKAICLKGPAKAKNDDDPRHEADRIQQKNRDDMLNKLTAFSLHSGRDLANRYSYSKANIVQATRDHDYLQEPFTEY